MRKMRNKISAWGACFALAVFTALSLFATFGARAAPLADGLAPVYKSEAEFPVRMYAGVIYRGGLVAVSNGIAYPAANHADWRVVGVATKTVDNTSTASGYSAARRCVVRQGIYAFANVQTGVDASTNAVYSLGVSDVGKPAYVVDDQTVGASSNALTCVAGTVVYVEPDTRFVWIDVGKAWAGSVALQPYVLSTNTEGLASGRLYLISSESARATNNTETLIGIMP